jgi:anti-sigma-K factor RskA
MTDAPLTPMEQDDALAGEYVLGVLDLAERTAVDDRIKRDAAFAARVAAWETRLAGLNDAYAEVPAPDLLPKIEARLFPQAAKPQRGWFGWLAGAATAAVIAIVAVMVLVPRTPAPEFLATLSAENQPVAFLASYAEGTLTVNRTQGTAADTGSVYELWLIVGDAAPVSLGLIESDSVSRAVANMPEGAIMAVSLEPEGGSTTGAPTGPVLVTGVVTRV